MQPKFIHDCGRCIFMGSDLGGDWYVCPHTSLETSSVIYRTGDEPSDNASMSADLVMDTTHQRPWIKKAQEKLSQFMLLYKRLPRQRS